MVSKKRITRRDAIKLSATVAGAMVLQQTSSAFASANKKTIQKHPEYARERFLKSMNCSQAVLETYAQEMGMEVEQARRVAAAFAGGMGMGSECGAVTGALMVIGMKHGKVVDKDGPADKATFSRVSEFVKKFEQEHGSIHCSKLLGTDMGTPEGVKAAADQGLFTSKCPQLVATASQILDDIL